VSQWLSFRSDGASYYARRHWRQLGGLLPEPRSTAEALQRRGELMKPAAIGLSRNGGYLCVESVRPADADVR
jgi:hypothetical protein